MAGYKPAMAYRYERGKEGQDCAPLPDQCPGCRADPGEAHTVTDSGSPCPERAVTGRTWPAEEE